MKTILTTMISLLLLISAPAFTDTFAIGIYEFDIDFLPISASTNPDPSETGYVDYEYRIGTYEISNIQWSKFIALNGQLNGDPAPAYDHTSTTLGPDMPVNYVSWYEAAQFVNWLNTSSGKQPAYKFTGTPGQADYAFAQWQPGDNGYNPENPFRNTNAYYFLPTEHEWVKAAFWNGTNIQNYATPDDTLPIAGVEANYAVQNGSAWEIYEGITELNGTYNMTGNLVEWLEGPAWFENFTAPVHRGQRGASYWIHMNGHGIESSDYGYDVTYNESFQRGIRIASVPEPATIMIISLGTLLIRRK